MQTENRDRVGQGILWHERVTHKYTRQDMQTFRKWQTLAVRCKTVHSYIYLSKHRNMFLYYLYIMVGVTKGLIKESSTTLSINLSLFGALIEGRTILEYFWTSLIIREEQIDHQICWPCSPKRLEKSLQQHWTQRWCWLVCLGRYKSVHCSEMLQTPEPAKWYPDPSLLRVSTRNYCLVKIIYAALLCQTG